MSFSGKPSPNLEALCDVCSFFARFTLLDEGTFYQYEASAKILTFQPQHTHFLNFTGKMCKPSAPPRLAPELETR
jgi:hypothetical protein